MALSTADAWRTFENNLSRDPQKVAKCLYKYLVEGFNQKDVNTQVYGHFDYNYVSIIQQCYNLKGKNSGKYSGIKLGGKVTQDDIFAFVHAYPNGILDSINPGSGIELETFLRDRILKREKRNARGMYSSDDFEMMDQDIDGADFYQYDEDAGSAKRDTIKGLFSSRRRSARSASQPYENAQPQKDSTHEMPHEVIGCGAVIVLLVILALVFNWFGLRTKLAVLLINVLMYAWVLGLLVFLIMLIFDKVSAMSGKSFWVKAITFIAIGIATFIILIFVLDILTRIK